MVRPLQADVYAVTKPGAVCPKCSKTLVTWSDIASHWQAGHFDYETNDPLTPNEAGKILVTLLAEIRTARALVRAERGDLSGRLARIEENFEQIEKKLNEVGAAVGGFKL